MGVTLQLLIGNRGDDSFFANTTLRNGWKVSSVYLGHLSGTSMEQLIWTEGSASAYITEARVGTTSPYVAVHWWHDAFSSLSYVPQVVIEGPKGVPHL
jgi:hypothetical protein